MFILVNTLKNSRLRKNYILLAENEYLQGNKEKAIDFYLKSLEFKGSKEEDIEILFNLALIYDELDLALESKKAYERIIELDNNNPGAYYGVAIMEERLGDYQQALLNFKGL